MVWCTIGRWRGEELALETLRSDLQAQGYTSVYIGVYIYMASRPALLRVAMVGVAVILIILSSSLGMIINLSKVGIFNIMLYRELCFRSVAPCAASIHLHGTPMTKLTFTER